MTSRQDIKILLKPSYKKSITPPTSILDQLMADETFMKQSYFTQIGKVTCPCFSSVINVSILSLKSSFLSLSAGILSSFTFFLLQVLGM